MIEPFFYLLLLLAAITCITLCDWRFKLVFFKDAARAIKVIATGMLIFIIWDMLGISLGIFFEGQSPYVTTISVAPELPVEELFFLFLLNYVALCLYRFWEETC